MKEKPIYLAIARNSGNESIETENSDDSKDDCMGRAIGASLSLHSTSSYAEYMYKHTAICKQTNYHLGLEQYVIINPRFEFTAEECNSISWITYTVYMYIHAGA